MDSKFVFVDVPGYGYAKESKKAREKWGAMIEAYITEREALKAVIQLIDMRHKPTEDDILMYDFLKYYEIPVIVVCTKMDKVPKSKVQRHLKIIKEGIEFEEEDTIIPFSSTDKKNLPLVLQTIADHI